MQGPLINILIRTTGSREQEFVKCIDSIHLQMYKNIKLIICTDSEDWHINYINTIASDRKLNFEIIRVTSTGVPFHWNFYCNNLKERVTDGWFFYLDDDDYLVNDSALSRIAAHLTNPREGVICQFNRGSRPKPDYGILELEYYPHDKYVKPECIVRGRIGGSCIFLHHWQKDIAHWDGKRAADYRFIKAVAEKIPLKFVPVVVVQAGNKGRHGK